MKAKILALMLLLGAAACHNDYESTYTKIFEGMRPIYASNDSLYLIYTGAPENIVNLGKIYQKGNTLFIGEKNRGVHVIDNSDPAQPQRLAFIHIKANHDIAIKGNYLYADNANDLVCLDVSNWQNLQEVSRVKDLYAPESTAFPENYHGYFECADPDKGAIVGWETATLTNPQCYR